jgi:four helix bundle protein
MRRASRSSTRNIAERFGRYSYRENIKFCIFSRGSQYELIDDVISCKEDLYINDSEYSEARKLLSKSIAILNGYINYLEREDAKTNRKK